MKSISDLTSIRLNLRKAIYLGLIFAIFGCSKNTSEVKYEKTEKDASDKDIIWNIKAIHPEGRMINVKALDKNGNIYDVKAIQDSDQRHLLDIKAFVGETKMPVKILLSDDKYAPVKAIGNDGTIYDIKALTSNGDILDVKGVASSGNIIHIKAINKEGEFYGIKAISPDGQLNDVKGVKMKKERLETKINGVDVHAHIKALIQTD